MAWIGSDGSEGKEGKEDCSAMLGVTRLGLSAASVLNIAPVRSIYKVTFTGLTSVAPDVLEASGRHWQSSLAPGDLDAWGPNDDDSGYAIIFSSSRQSVENIASNDPLIAAGATYQIDEYQL
jgi:hypothetical protein